MERIKKILLNNKDGKNVSIGDLLEIYKLYHDAIEKNSGKKQNTNSFFLSLNTGILAVIGFLFQKDAAVELKPLYMLLPVAGIISSFFWFKLVLSYRQLSSSKFEILNMIEELLPLAPYKAEWHLLGEGKDKKKYHQITTLEKWIPILFIFLYGLLSLYFIYLLLINKMKLL